MIGRATRRRPTGRAMRLVLAAAALVLALASLPPTAGSAPAEPPPALQILTPGGVGSVLAQLPVNVVFVGYEEGLGPDEVDLSRFDDGLEEFTASVVRSALGNGVVRPAGVDFLLDYRLSVADDAFEDAFFAHLLDIGTPRPLTEFQATYNQQPSRELDIADPLAIDAPSVEHWLAANAGPGLGVDTRQPTVFLVNWHGRDDFRFHVYTKTGDPDPDTGVDFGLRDDRTMIAWGGTAADDPSNGTGVVSRVWFHDLSAGPEYESYNFDLTNADIDEFDGADYRIPPVWEYGSTDDYRPFTDLTGDLALVVRYVATDLLFAPSPLYNVAISPPALPSSVSIDVNRVVVDDVAPAPLSIPAMLDPLTRLQPWTEFSATVREQPFRGRLAQVFDCWLTAFDGPWRTDPTFTGESCYGKRASGYAFYDLFFWAYDNQFKLVGDDADHHVPTLLFDTDDIPAGSLAGLAAENLYDFEYSQFMVLAFMDPLLWQDFGLGPAALLAHEAGHHLGLSHPHDGVDIDDGVIRSIVPTGAQYFAWLGGESATVMSYLKVESEFSQFDQDAMARWVAIANLNQAQQILEDIFASPRAREVDELVVLADHDALITLIAWDHMDYQVSAAFARQAYQRLVDAAAAINVPVEPPAAPADAKSRALEAFFVDPVPPLFVAPRPGPQPNTVLAASGPAPGTAVDGATWRSSGE